MPAIHPIGKQPRYASTTLKNLHRTARGQRARAPNMTTSEATLTDDDIERLGQAAERGEYPGTSGDFITITPVVAERTQYAHMPQRRSQLDGDPNKNLDHTPSKR